MAQFKPASMLSDIRGRMGEIVFTHGLGGNKLLRQFNTPQNPSTPAQQTVRRKFTAIQAMYRKGFDAYAALTGVSVEDQNSYLSRVLQYRNQNPITKKQFAVGFESGGVSARAYNIGHSYSRDLVVAKLSGGELRNDSLASVKVLELTVAGDRATADEPVAIDPAATLVPQAGTVAIVVFRGSVADLPDNWAELIALGGMTQECTQVLILASMGIRP
jgi:hypothetical protein